MRRKQRAPLLCTGDDSVPKLRADRYWLERSLASLRRKGDDCGAIRGAHEAYDRVLKELGIIETEPFLSPSDIEALDAIRPYGRVIYSNDFATIIIDSADDILATGTDEAIRALREQVLHDEVLPVCDGATTQSLERAKLLLTCANWLTIGYSKFRDIETLKRSW